MDVLAGMMMPEMIRMTMMIMMMTRRRLLMPTAVVNVEALNSAASP